jgi:hypothetical protein
VLAQHLVDVVGEPGGVAELEGVPARAEIAERFAQPLVAALEVRGQLPQDRSVLL